MRYLRIIFYYFRLTSLYKYFEQTAFNLIRSHFSVRVKNAEMHIIENYILFNIIFPCRLFIESHRLEYN